MAILQINVEPQVLEKYQILLAQSGLSLEAAFSDFIQKFLVEKEMSFPISENIPNEETEAVFDRVELMIQGKIPMLPTQSVEDFLKEMSEDNEF
ncbi:hypothetical protein FACS1894132_10000 [Clostridia bacterium]|nr:hypothetical protein FACS1894132_10000 [Clostridia bacterium]